MNKFYRQKSGTNEQAIINNHLRRVYDNRENIFPYGVAAPIYISLDDIPQNRRDTFFTELGNSVANILNNNWKNMHSEEQSANVTSNAGSILEDECEQLSFINYHSNHSDHDEH